MTDETDPPKTISVSDFKAHCTEQIRAVEEQGITLQITRHGKVVAIVEPPRPEGPTMEQWIGSGAAIADVSSETLASFDEPTWTDDEFFTDDEEEAAGSESRD